MATKTFVSGNWVGGVWAPVGNPTAADDVLFTATSGACTLNSGAVCRSLNCTGYTNTLTHNSGVTLVVGDGTAGLTNVALLFVVGMTYTKNNQQTSAITFSSSSVTQQTIVTGGKSLGNFTITSGSYLLNSSLTIGTGTTTNLSMSGGTLDTNGQVISIAGSLVFSNSPTLTLGASNIAVGNNVVSVPTLTLNPGTSILTISGSSFTGGTLTWYDVVLDVVGSVSIADANTFHTLTRTGGAVRSNTLSLSANQTCTTLVANSNSDINRLFILSSVIGIARTITAGTFTATNVTVFKDITGAGAATWTAGASGATYLGDAGGNSGITFTTPATQMANGTTSFNWSDNTRWTSRVPLPQDDVVVSNNFASSQTITADMTQLGKNVTFSCTGSPTWVISSGNSFFGSIDISGLGTLTTQTLTAEGRTTPFTVTCGGKTFPNTMTLNAPGGTLSLADTYLGQAFAISQGTFNTNNQSMSLTRFVLNASLTKIVNLGSSTITCAPTVTTNAWDFTTVTGLTFDAGTSTIVIGGTDNTSVKSFVGNGQTYYNLSLTGDNILITGSNTFNNIAFNNPNNVVANKFMAGTTQIVASLSTTASSGNIVTITSSLAGSAASISKASGIVALDYLSLKDSTASGGATFYAGTNSTNVSGNTGWLFSSPSAPGATTYYYQQMIAASAI